MEKNGINIINDIDKENDDLMTHLGILQQFSLGEKTNVLKNIKSYKENASEINEINNINEDNNFKKLEIKTNNKNNLYVIKNLKYVDNIK